MSFRFVLIVALVVVLGLAACGPTPATRSTDTGSSQAAPAPAATTAPATSMGDATKGKELFAGTCAACHGPDGKGIQGLGKDLTASDFVASQSDEQLLAFVKVGRRPTDPANTTGVDMPPKGGNPALSDEELQDIIAYIRTIHKE
ncbi:MAG: cytochrome c [Ardenticatenaceae bacterium]|nr:cytochrome c [Ardenticatenaceae bacterium]HBY97482.1 hypothetical protein [Chloroflexota bacterium]